jgi:hypothetical protein
MVASALPQLPATLTRESASSAAQRVQSKAQRPQLKPGAGKSDVNMGILTHHLDRHLVVSFVETLHAFLIWRHRNLGLLLSELGRYLAAAGYAAAGTKRLSNLLRSKTGMPS